MLLHPDVYFDGETQVGYTGQLAEADVEADRFYVDLGNGKEPKLFASDWLMVLKDRDQIFELLTCNTTHLEQADVKDLYRICLLLDSPEPEHQQSALEIASANEQIREHVLVTLEDSLGPAKHLSRGR